MRTMSGARQEPPVERDSRVRRRASGPDGAANLLGVGQRLEPRAVVAQHFGGGAPTSLHSRRQRRDATASIPLPVTETFSFAGVPPGTYTFSVRAINAAGTSGSSNPVTLTFPTTLLGIAVDAGQPRRVQRPATSSRSTGSPPPAARHRRSYMVNVSGRIHTAGCRRPPARSSRSGRPRARTTFAFAP